MSMRYDVVTRKCFLMIYFSDPLLMGSIPGDLFQWYIEEKMIDENGKLSERGMSWLQTMSVPPERLGAAFG
jgi:hypothetical protein